MRNDGSPIAIAGCGCAGLSLAVHLLATPGFDRPLVLIDPRQPDHYTNDRTWCGFETASHPFSDLVTRRWHAWQVSHNGQLIRTESTAHPYVCLPADRFYARCFQRLTGDRRVTTLFGHTAHAAVDSADSVDAVPTDGGPTRRIRVAHLFDGRTPPPTPTAAGEVTLYQQFVGQEVKTEVDTFDPDCATLMDFDGIDALPPDTIRFLYVLPFTKRHALIECTAFTPRILPNAAFSASVEHHLRHRHGLSHWTLVRGEQGVIPMNTARPSHRPRPHVTQIGTAGGLVKPSTGYAFAAIQEHSATIAASLAAGTLDDRRPGRWVSLALDRIFLSYLNRFPQRAPALFARISAGTSGDRFARFMMNHGTAADDLAVIASMPKLPFMIEAMRSWRLWARGDSRAHLPLTADTAAPVAALSPHLAAR